MPIFGRCLEIDDLLNTFSPLLLLLSQLPYRRLVHSLSAVASWTHFRGSMRCEDLTRKCLALMVSQLLAPFDMTVDCIRDNLLCY